MAHSTKVKIAENATRDFAPLVKVERWTGSYAGKPTHNITIDDGTVAFVASVPALERAFGRYNLTAEAAVGHAWRIHRQPETKYLDVTMLVNGAEVTTAEYLSGQFAQDKAAQGLSDRPEPDEDFLDFPDEKEEFPAPMVQHAPRPAPKPAPALASSEAVAAIKDTLRPDQAAERDKITGVIVRALEAARDAHLRVSHNGTVYPFDGSAVQATGYTIFREWTAKAVAG